MHVKHGVCSKSQTMESHSSFFITLNQLVEASSLCQSNRSSKPPDSRTAFLVMESIGYLPSSKSLCGPRDSLLLAHHLNIFDNFGHRITTNSGTITINKLILFNFVIILQFELGFSLFWVVKVLYPYTHDAIGKDYHETDGPTVKIWSDNVQIFISSVYLLKYPS